MATAKKEYLAWINGGMVGTHWRADTIREAVGTCAVIFAQDWGSLRGNEVAVGVYEVNEPGSPVLLAGLQGSAFLGNSIEKEAELPLLSLIKVDIPTLRKNGNACSKSYKTKVRKAADTALHNVIGN
jgi:hypothetical protein